MHGNRRKAVGAYIRDTAGELGSSEMQAWHSMQLKTNSLVNPFLCPEFSLGVGRVQSAARVAVLTEGSEILGFFPFERRRLGAGAAMGAGLSNCQGLIHAPGAEWDARELLKACKLSTWQFNRLVQGQKPFQPYAADQVLSAVIDLSDGFEAYQESFRLRSPRFLKGLNRSMRSLQRNFGETRFVGDSAIRESCAHLCRGSRISVVKMAGLISSPGHGWWT